MVDHPSSKGVFAYLTQFLFSILTHYLKVDGADKRRMGGHLALVGPLVPPLYVAYAQSPVLRLLETQRKSGNKYKGKSWSE